MITMFYHYYAKDGSFEYEYQRQVMFEPIAEMIEFESLNIEGFRQKIIFWFLLEGIHYTATFTEFQVDEMGAIVKEVTARDSKYHASARAEWKIYFTTIGVLLSFTGLFSISSFSSKPSR